MSSWCPMSPFPGHFLARKSLRRRLTSAALLTAYVTTAAGIPLPSGARPQRNGELYPCAGGSCGCATAEHCWKSCCCHTLAERFAWARQHAVRPPAYAIAAARQAGLHLAWLGEGTGPHFHSSTKSCCHRSSDDAKKMSCHETVASASAHVHRTCCAHKHDLEQNTNTADHIVVWRALNCQGHSMNWLAAVPTLIVARPAVSRPALLVTWLVPAISEPAEQLAEIPPVPPPERA